MKLVILNGKGRVTQKIKIGWFSGLMLALFTLGVILLSGNGLNALFFKKEHVSVYERHVLQQFEKLIVKTAKLEAQVKRLNSLSKTLADENELDIQDFLLDKDPAMGGLIDNNLTNVSLSSSIISKEHVQNNIEDLEIELKLQAHRFQVIKNSYSSREKKKVSRNNKRIHKTSFSPPVKSGYISSSFGNRRDPINGHRRHHNGIDIAAKHGSKIHAIASGFVTFVGRKGGYGNVIEINHDETLKSLYAHLYKMNVKKGQVVRKGDVIASMGQTGRATGSHLHLEVSKNGKAMNPTKFINTALLK